MELTGYIKDLLYRYDCVIVPNFGGFITNRIGARLDNKQALFYPPSKQIMFNSHLKVNDGLLANYIAESDGISYDNALDKIKIAVSNWRNQLQENILNLNDIGVLKLNENRKIVFEPNRTINYLSDSYGLAATPVSVISKEESKIIPLQTHTNKTTRKGIPAFIKYAASAAILLTLSFAVYTGYQENQQKEILANQEKALEEKIQTATFVISNPLPTIELNVNKEVTKPYHIVAGAFQFPENAEKKVKQLKKLGYKASILGVNKWGLTEVVFSSFTDRNKATNELYKIQDTVSKDAWLLIKK